MFPISKQTLEDTIRRLGIVKMTSATIRQICALAAALEEEAGERFVHLEIGNPGLPAVMTGVNAEIEALKGGIANKYPDIAGIPRLKKAGSEFVKAFLDIDISPRGIAPTVGSMQGCFTMLLLLGQRVPGKDTMLYINPGFPAQRNQAKILGLKEAAFDIYNYRGDRLEPKLRSILDNGNVTGIIYSNPNNPAWTNLTEQELDTIGRLATEYDVFVLEDLAYFGMDFRHYMGEPYREPFVPTVAKYTDNYILLLSASKIFSYAGQRIALVCMGDKVAARRFPYLEQFYEMPTFGDAYIYGVLYTASSGTAHSAQYAMAAMLEEATAGRLDFVGLCGEYGRRGGRARKIFLDNGFHLVYDRDGDRPVSDGFFFTAGYKGMDSEQLHSALLRFGVSSIPLPSTGSKQDGVRICVSLLDNDEAFNILDERLKAFRNEH